MCVSSLTMYHVIRNILPMAQMFVMCFIYKTIAIKPLINIYIINKNEL